MHQVEQAAGRGDEDVDAARQRAHLRPLADAAEDDGVDCRRRCAAVGAEALGDLRGELARRATAPGTRQSRRRRGALGLAARRWRIGSAKAAVLPVPVCAMPSTSRPASSSGMACVLDRGRRDVVLFSEGTKDRLGEAEVVKKVQFKVFLCAAGPSRVNAGETPNAGFETSRVDRAVSSVECRRTGLKI